MRQPAYPLAWSARVVQVMTPNDGAVAPSD